MNFNKVVVFGIGRDEFPLVVVADVPRVGVLLRVVDVLHPNGGDTRHILIFVPGGDKPARGAYLDDYLNKTSSEKFDQYRWQIARHILKLMMIKVKMIL